MPLNITASATQQHFFVPHCAPFLEIRTTLNSALPYAEHFHSAFSLGLILQGKTRFFVNNTAYSAEEGDIVLIAQGMAHSCNPIDGPRSYHMILIDMTWLREHRAHALARCAQLIKDATLFCKAMVAVEAIRANEPEAPLLLATFLQELIARHGGKVASDAEHEALWPVLNVPDEGYDAPLSVTKLAQAANMRRESFSRAVRRKTGLAPSHYLHCLRLEKARFLLRQGKSIAEAALASGYVDQSHFHRMFVRFYAVTPGRYRNDMLHLYKK